MDDLPGPPRLPLVGNALGVKLSDVHRIMENWSREYGPFFRAQFGPRKVLVVSDHEVIGHILRNRPGVFRRPARLEAVVREMGIELGLFNVEGEVWQNQRRMVMAGFSPGNVRAYFPSLVKVTQRLQRRWEKAAREGESIDLQADLMRFTVDAITGLAFGADINTLESDEDIIQHHLDKLFPALFKRVNALVPYWRFVRLPVDRELDRSIAVVNKAIEGFIGQARERMRANPALHDHPGNLLEAMIAAADQSGSGVDDRDVAGNVFTLLLAGEDTTANSLVWLIHLLHRHPDALRLAQQEVRRVAGDPAAFTVDQMAALDYVEACAHESMRLKPVAPYNVVEPLHDTTVGDIHVPIGTLVWCASRVDALDERYFANPQAFDPERWLGEGGPSALATTAKRVATPFGMGPRVCPGRYLALLEIKLAMAMLLARFEILGVDTPDGGEAQEFMAFAMTPVGLRMRLALRD